tara:strand:+ start:273 stop:380 length:108 start_codon:yes stop_codon:yes gene_type:complete
METAAVGHTHWNRAEPMVMTLKIENRKGSVYGDAN